MEQPKIGDSRKSDRFVLATEKDIRTLCFRLNRKHHIGPRSQRQDKVKTA